MKKLRTELAVIPCFVRSIVPTLCISQHTAAAQHPLRKPGRPFCGFGGRTFSVLPENQNSTSLAIIRDRVARDSGSHPSDLETKSREQRIACARQVAMYLCRKIIGAPFETIDEHFNRNHCTVICAWRLIERRIRGGAAFELFVAKLEGRIIRTVPAYATEAA